MRHYFYNRKKAGTLAILLADFSLIAVIVLSLLGALVPLISNLRNVSAESITSTEKVYTHTVDTSKGEDGDSGWWFDRDKTTSTAYEFNTDESSIGEGSLYVPPIGTNAKDKFIAEHFVWLPVEDLESISYDFLIAGNGSASDANEFYLNIYANLPGSAANNYFDCRYDYVPTSGSTEIFTTALFTPNTTPSNVKSREGATCPATLSELDNGSTVRMYSISVGDTNAGDAGLAGYLDNVRLATTTGTTVYDFEYSPDPNDEHVLSLLGTVYRDFDTNHCNGPTDCKSYTNERLSGWEMQLYKEDATGAWEYVRSATTDANGIYKLGGQRDAGTYHTCEVLQPGWTQPVQNWSGSGYLVNTPSGPANNPDLGPYCTTTVYTDEKNLSKASNFGNVDNLAPEVSEIEISPLVPDMVTGGDVRVEFTLTEAHEVNLHPNLTHVRFTLGKDAEGNRIDSTAYPVQQVAGEENRYFSEIPTTNFVPEGTEATNFRLYFRTEDNIGAGNQAGVSFYKNQITIDNQAPSQPQMLGFYKNNDISSPIIPCGGYTNNTKIQIHWQDNTEEDFAYYWFGTKSNVRHKKVTSRSYYNGNMTPGNNPYTYTVIAVDHLGNESPVSVPCGLTLDMEAPVASIINPAIDGELLNDPITVTGEVDDAEENIKSHWFEITNPDGSLSYAYDMNTTEKSFSFTLDTTAGDGEYSFRYVATDRAGNRSDANGSAIRTIIVDNSAPKIISVYGEQSGNSLNGNLKADIVNEDGLTIEWKALTPGSSVTNPDSLNTNVKVDEIGDYEFELNVTDAAGNVSKQTVIVSFTQINNRGSQNNSGTPPGTSNPNQNTPQFAAFNAPQNQGPQLLGANTDNQIDENNATNSNNGEVLGAQSSASSPTITTPDTKKTDLTGSSFNWWWLLAPFSLVLVGGTYKLLFGTVTS